MKKSMLNVITLALVLINLVLSVILTFSLITTSSKTDNLITKIANIIDLDVAGTDIGSAQDSSSAGVVDIGNLEVIDVVNGDSSKITVTITDSSGKVHYAVVNVVLSLNKNSKDYSSLRTNVDNGMKLIVSEVTTIVSQYSYENVYTSKTTIEQQILARLQELFKSDIVYSVAIPQIVVQ